MSKAIKPKRRYNWRRDLPDFRDHKYAIAAPAKGLPDSVDLRSQCSPVVDQGAIGSCTANALAGAFEFLELRELSGVDPGDEVFGKTFTGVSRLFIYYNERLLEGTVFQDGGARLQDGVKTLNQFGVCRESHWKYQKSLLFKKPNATAFREAASHKISEYLRINSLNELKQCLADGFPAVFGFTVYESFESPEVANSGVMPVPSANERVLGGHAVMAVGYDEKKKVVIARNSWGAEWGQAGYFLMPYEIITLGLAQDFWTLRK